MRCRLTDFRGLCAYESHHVNGDGVEVAGLGVFFVNVPLDFALFMTLALIKHFLHGTSNAVCREMAKYKLGNVWR